MKMKLTSAVMMMVGMAMILFGLIYSSSYLFLIIGAVLFGYYCAKI